MSRTHQSGLVRHAVRTLVEAPYGKLRQGSMSFCPHQVRVVSQAGISCVRRSVGSSDRRSLFTFAAAHRRPITLASNHASCNSYSDSVFLRPKQNISISITTSNTRTMATRGDAPQVPRRDSALSGPHDTYEAVVVGAGPAGIVAVGNLLEKKIDKILWVDESFNGGRVNQYYREVPSNTKTKLFVEFAEMISPFQKIVTGRNSSASDATSVNVSEDKLQDVRRLPQERGCQLSHAADICLMLTSGLKETQGVIAQTGRVASAALDSGSQTWLVALDNTENITNVQAKRLVLCTGSTPLDPILPYEPAGLEHINLDDALSPTNLSAKLSSLGPTTIAVIGASHSAVLVLMNLSKIALESKPDLQVKWFTRHPLRYAEYDDSGHVSARDNTGLKGQAAVWARENLEPQRLSTSPIGQVVEKIGYQKGDEEDVYRQHLDENVQFVVQAIGYTKNALPTIKTEDGEVVTPVFDHDKGVFNYTRAGFPELRQLPGVYGAGIAFPQRIKDKKYGHVEFNVGFMKFMKAVKGWVEEWNPVTL